jgi:tetratricopeptide (TPR) repeat protein
MLRKFFHTFLAIAITGISLQAQTLKTPAPSPLQTIKQAFALSDITVEYSRPSAKGRVVFGNVVPFEKIWRTGANAATKITFGEDVMVEGHKVAAGTYALYTIPNKNSWEIMLYNDLKLGGNTAEYKKENEVLRFTASPKNTAEKIETFTISISDMTATSTNIEMAWENTRVAFKVTADFDATLMKNIDAALATDTRPYYQAASYYYDNNKDLNKALEWANKAVEQNPKAFWAMQLKAKIEYKMKDYKSAIASAEKVIVVAKEAKNDDFVKQAEDLIAEAKKGK